MLRFSYFLKYILKRSWWDRSSWEWCYSCIKTVLSNKVGTLQKCSANWREIWPKLHLLEVTLSSLPALGRSIPSDVKHSEYHADSMNCWLTSRCRNKLITIMIKWFEGESKAIEHSSFRPKMLPVCDEMPHSYGDLLWGSLSGIQMYTYPIA